MKNKIARTEKKVKETVKILDLGEYYHIFNSTVIMNCPFNHKCKDNFMVNLKTGQYRCRHCGNYGKLKYLPIDMSISITPISKNECKDVLTFVYEFHNKNKLYSIEDVLMKATFAPTVILNKNIENEDSFCLVYFVANENMTSRRQIELSLNFRDSFHEYYADEVKYLLNEKIIGQYKEIITNENFYYRPLEISTTKLQKLSDLLEEEGEIIYEYKEK